MTKTTCDLCGEEIKGEPAHEGRIRGRHDLCNACLVDIAQRTKQRMPRCAGCGKETYGPCCGYVYGRRGWRQLGVYDG